MSDESAVIYGIESQTRALCSNLADEEMISFYVGTQSLKIINQVHLVQFDDVTNQLTSKIFLHEPGEINDLSCSPCECDLIGTVHSVSNQKLSTCTIWRVPATENSNEDPLIYMTNFPDESERCINLLWEPDSGKKNVVLLSHGFRIWDLSTEKTIGRIVFENAVTSGQWSSYHNSCLVGLCSGSCVHFWDLRSFKNTFSLSDAHPPLVRDINFNPNRHYIFATCGDDCRVRFWDQRNVKEALNTFGHHSHWVWCVKYNRHHDQLCLTSSTDSSVNLYSIPTISSESEDNMNASDHLIKVYDEHEDSVYAVDWSAVDPWIFASLSYDGRLVISRVPKQEKFDILLNLSE